MITVSIDGGDALLSRVRAMKAATQNMEPALLRGGIAALKAAADRIDAGGPGWPPLVGPPHSLLHVTGRLLSSLTVGGPGNVVQLNPNSIQVGTNIKTDDGNWNLGALLQGGTGVYAGKGPITAKNGKALRFELGGAVVFARSVKGVPPRPFLLIDEPLADTVAKIFAAHIMGTPEA
jgi:hypothetical protein